MILHFLLRQYTQLGNSVKKTILRVDKAEVQAAPLPHIAGGEVVIGRGVGEGVGHA